MAFSSDPIQESLHILEGKELHSKAVAAFLNVMKYMTDYPTRSSNLAPFAQEITKRMLGYEALRDEIFLQICKQVSNNPRIESELKGWELMNIAVCTCRPSNDFFKYLKAFMQRSFTASSGHELKARLIKMALISLEKSRKSKFSRTMPPSLAEIAAIEKAGIFIYIYIYM